MGNIPTGVTWTSNRGYISGWSLHHLPRQAAPLRHVQKSFIKRFTLGMEPNQDFILNHIENFQPILQFKRPAGQDGLEFRRFLYYQDKKKVLEDGIEREEFFISLNHNNFIKNPMEAQLINYIRSQFSGPYSRLNVMRKFTEKIKQVRGN